LALSDAPNCFGAWVVYEDDSSLVDDLVPDVAPDEAAPLEDPVVDVLSSDDEPVLAEEPDDVEVPSDAEAPPPLLDDDPELESSA
jgi:hypothetical protein